jgi:hypothetical protein
MAIYAWRMGIACWIPKATNTHSQYVTLTAHSTAIMVARTRLNVTYIRGKKLWNKRRDFIAQIHKTHLYQHHHPTHNSNHPTQHKYGTVKFLYNRLNTYDVKKEEYQHELNIIHNILHNTSFPVKPQKPHIHTLVQGKPSQTPKHRWATFTFVGKKTSYINKIFRQNSK